MTDDATIDAYLAKLPTDQREALQRVRNLVARLVPEAEESISYGLPTFKLHGRSVLWFAAWKRHCSVYPLTDSFAAANAAALRRYRRTRGSLHFTTEAPLPEDLVERLVQARLADLAGRSDPSDARS